MALVRTTLEQARKRKLTAKERTRLDGLTEKQINAAARRDPDNPPSNRKELAQMAAIIRGRGRPPLPVDKRKVRLTLRLPQEVLKYFRSLGSGWQSKISDALAEHVKRRKAR
jgi:uncharacterized protein (DUF4415 family)